MIKKIKTLNKQYIFGMITGILAIGLIVAASYGVIAKKEKSNWLSVNEIETKSTQYINSELLNGKGTVTVKVIGEENNLYKLDVKYNGQSTESYVTKDGKRFFPEALSMISAKDDTNNQKNTNIDIPKSDKPKVELFVMSYCPYGTQMEKGMLPVVKTLGDKIDFNLKFVSYIMHGDKEAQENLRQYCIMQTQNYKYYDYLSCFLKAGDSANCMQSVGIDQGKNKDCQSAAAAKYDITGTNFSIFKADNEKYGVSGSPALVINGATVESGRDSNSLLKTVCSSFNVAPEECQKDLSSATPVPGFGEGTQTGGSSSAECQ